MRFNTIEEVPHDKRGKIISLTRKYNQLDVLTKEAINNTFLLNMRSTAGKNQLSVADAVKEFYGKEFKVK